MTSIFVFFFFFIGKFRIHRKASRAASNHSGEFLLSILMFCIESEVHDWIALQEVNELSMLFQEESALPASEPAVTLPPLPSEPLVSQQARGGDTRRAHGHLEKVTVSICLLSVCVKLQACQ